MSEVDIRRVNGLRAGGATATGQILEDCGYQDCLETVVKELEYDKPCEQVAPNLIRAKGIAGGWKSPSQPTDVASAAIIRMNEDGTFMLMTSGQDIGQGSDTVLTQIAAEVLDILAHSAYSRYFDKDNFVYIEYSAGSIRYNLAKKYLTFSQNTTTAFVAFMVLQEIEIENLINIIEGVRYKQDISQMRALLIRGGV